MFLTVRLKKLLPAAGILLALLALLVLWPRRGAAPADAEMSEPALPVLIIDAGHGGEDGGASAGDGTTESGINLAVAQRLEALAGLYGVETVMTRTTQELEYPEDATTTARRKAADQRARIARINAYPEGVLISIHQNCFPDSRPSGCQVLYAATAGSEALAKLMHEQLSETLCPSNRRVAAPVSDKILLMRSARCTAVLVECGFLSNAAEAKLLASPDYQTKISAVLLASYLDYAAQRSGLRI